MNLLILGASGFIGNAAVDYFSKNNSVTGVDRINPGTRDIVIDPDFSVTKKLIASGNFDVLLNCAGSSNITESFTNTERDFSLNVALVQSLLNEIKTSSPQTKVINLSSAAVYGNPRQLPVHESAPLEPISPYGFHKLLSENLVTHYAALFSIPALSVRIFSAYGPGLRRQFFFDLFSKFNTQPHSIELNGTGKESRDFVFISDILDAIQILINNAPFKGEVYNLAGQQESQIQATAKLFAKICNYKGGINFTQKQFEGYPLNWCADISKLKSLGFSPAVTLEDGLKNYFNWLKTGKQ